jgi:hypothetical protein
MGISKSNTKKATEKTTPAKRKKPVKRSKISKQTKRLGTKKLLFVYTVLVVLCATSAGAIASSKRNAPLADPFSIAQQAINGFPTYYPSRLPAGYQLDTTSLDRVQQGVLAFSLANGNGSAINFTEQKAPEDFNFTTFYSTFGNRKSFKVPLGQVTSGTIDDGKTYLASMLTPDKTWVLMNAKTAVPDKDLKYIFEHLTRSK